MPFIQLKFKLLFCCALVVLLLTACRNGATTSATKPVATAVPTSRTDDSESLPKIVAFGDSLTAGFGLNDNQSFTVLLQRKLDEKGYRYLVVNAGVSGDTSAGGVRRIDWSLQGDVKFLILELGGNDALRGLPISELKTNLAQIIERSQSRGVIVILAGMEAPPNMGEQYTREFRQAYRDLAKKYKVTLIPFVLEGVGGRPELNQADGIHPNAEGERVMTENVWRVLEPFLNTKQTK